MNAMEWNRDLRLTAAEINARERAPHDLETIVDLARLPGMLAKRGYPPADIEKVMHGNWLRFLRNAWG